MSFNLKNWLSYKEEVKIFEEGKYTKSVTIPKKILDRLRVRGNKITFNFMYVEEIVQYIIDNNPHLKLTNFTGWSLFISGCNGYGHIKVKSQLRFRNTYLKSIGYYSV